MKKTILALCLMSAVAATASAHTTFETKEVPVNSTYKAVLRVPHGCNGTATNSIRITLPEGIIKAKPMPKAGWDLEVIQGKFEKTYSYHGKEISEGPQQIIWKNGNLPNDFFDEFIFRARVTNHFKVGEKVYFPVIQTCEDGSNEWVTIPAADAKKKPKRPAPSITIIGQAHSGH